MQTNLRDTIVLISRKVLLFLFPLMALYAFLSANYLYKFGLIPEYSIFIFCLIFICLACFFIPPKGSYNYSIFFSFIFMGVVVFALFGAPIVFKFKPTNEYMTPWAISFLVAVLFFVLSLGFSRGNSDVEDPKKIFNELMIDLGTTAKEEILARRRTMTSTYQTPQGMIELEMRQYIGPIRGSDFASDRRSEIRLVTTNPSLPQISVLSAHQAIEIKWVDEETATYIDSVLRSKNLNYFDFNIFTLNENTLCFRTLIILEEKQAWLDFTEILTYLTTRINAIKDFQSSTTLSSL